MLGPRSLRAVLCAVLISCATCGGTPPRPKGERTIILDTEYRDRDLGEDAALDVAEQMGIVADPALAAYVQELGERLSRHTMLRPFEYRFAIVDQFEPNAFALPGGYIFVSRGLLALANSEDELANVLGHEITHAAARHAAAQQEVARRQNPLAMPYMRAAYLAAYSRDQERDADRGGQMIAAAAGYDPMGMSTFLENLGNVERLRMGHSRLPSFFDTHPGATERTATAAARAREIGWSRSANAPDSRASYLEHIDGIELGVRPSEGVIRSGSFLHPDLDFHLRFPDGWRVSNAQRAVGASPPTGGASIFLEIQDRGGDPVAAARSFVTRYAEELRIEVLAAQRVDIRGLPAFRLDLNGVTGGFDVAAQITFVAYRDLIYRITCVAPRNTAKKHLALGLNTVRSFRPLTPEERDSIQSLRLRVVTAMRGEGISALSERTGNVWDTQRTAVLNAVYADVRFEGGESVKIARAEPYTPEAPPPPNTPDR